jgi:hypothetical protein
MTGSAFAGDETAGLDQPMLDRGILNAFSYRLMMRQHQTAEALIEDLEIDNREIPVAG